jgi:hypothetical protein
MHEFTDGCSSPIQEQKLHGWCKSHPRGIRLLENYPPFLRNIACMMRPVDFLNTKLIWPF